MYHVSLSEANFVGWCSVAVMLTGHALARTHWLAALRTAELSSGTQGDLDRLLHASWLHLSVLPRTYAWRMSKKMKKKIMKTVIWSVAV